MIFYSVWEFIVKLFRRRKSAPPTRTEQLPKNTRIPTAWRSSRRAVEDGVGRIAAESSARSTEIILGRNCDLCSDRLDGRDTLIAHYLQTHEVPAGIRGGGTGGIECPVCHYEYEIVAEQVLHYVATHSG